MNRLRRWRIRAEVFLRFWWLLARLWWIGCGPRLWEFVRTPLQLAAGMAAGTALGWLLRGPPTPLGLHIILWFWAGVTSGDWVAKAIILDRLDRERKKEEPYE
jgi:hypothetical protein